MDELLLYNEVNSASDVAFAVPKGSHVGTKFSKSIYHLTKNGDLQRILNGWGFDESNSDKIKRRKGSIDPTMKFRRYSLKYGLTLAMALGIAAIFCVFLLLLENWLINFQVNKIKLKHTFEPSRYSRKYSTSPVSRRRSSSHLNIATLFP